MSSEKTPNLQLHRWQPSDYVLRTEFNDNFAKIDDHAKQVNEQLADIADVQNKIGILSKKTNWISVTEFGAKGDWKLGTGTYTVDTNAIQQAITEAQNTGLPLFFPKVAAGFEGYAIDDTITIPAGIDVYMDSPVVYVGSQNIPALVIGEENIVNSLRTLKVGARRATISDWTDENSIGILIHNLQQSKLIVTWAYDFTIGLQCMGSRQGWSYNQVELLYIINNKIGVDLTNEANGWCNENIFINGRFACNTGVNKGKSRFGVRITSKDGTYTNNNNNNFIKPSFELKANQASPGEAIPVLIEHGQQNSFLKCRDEANSATFARILNNSSNNEFDIGYGGTVGIGNIEIIDDQSRYPVTIANSLRMKNIYEGVTIFNSGALHKKACYYDGSSKIHIPEVFIANYPNSNIDKANSSITLNSDYLEFGGSRGVGIVINTKKFKRFVVKLDVEAYYGGRINIRCYDINGNQLTDQSPNHPYVKGATNNSPHFSSSFGGVYRTGSDSGNDFYFVLHPDAEKIHLLITGGTNPLRIRGFQVISLDGYCSVYAGYEEIQKGANIGIAPPTSGTWTKGRTILNDNPVELGEAGSKYIVTGWRCIADGTPGTWVEMRSYTGN